MIGTIARYGVAMALAALTLAPAASQAQPFPSRPLKIVVGFAPGGSSDLTARAIGDVLSKRLGQPIIIENKPGAGGLTATDQVAKATPDGYTLWLVPSGHSVTGAMRKNLPFHAVDDFTWLSTLVTYGMAFGVRPDSPYKTLAEFIAAAKAAPPKSMSYYSVGPGTAHHLLGEWLNAAAGIELVHVPYRGSTPALADFISGRVDLMIDTMTFVLPQTEGGNVRPLAVTSSDRPGIMANVPFSGSIIEGLEYESWLGLAAPKGLPADVAKVLVDAIRESVKSPEFAAKMAPLGAAPKDSTSAELRARVERDIERFKRVVAARSIAAE
jgi:tripartite-type tricarboxylate transporter receptor subunit TctC